MPGLKKLLQRFLFLGILLLLAMIDINILVLYNCKNTASALARMHQNSQIPVPVLQSFQTNRSCDKRNLKQIVTRTNNFDCSKRWQFNTSVWTCSSTLPYIQKYLKNITLKSITQNDCFKIPLFNMKVVGSIKETQKKK